MRKHFYDIDSTININEPLNTISSIIYLISSILVYKQNKPLSLTTLLLSIGSIALHSYDSTIGGIVDNFSINLILLIAIMRPVRLVYALLISVMVIVVLVGGLHSINIYTNTIYVIFTGLIYATSYLELVRTEIKNKNYYKVILFYSALIGYLLLLNNANKYKKIEFIQSFYVIILYFMAAMFQIYSRIENKNDLPFNKYYHSMWHLISGYLIVYLSKIL